MRLYLARYLPRKILLIIIPSILSQVVPTPINNSQRMKKISSLLLIDDNVAINRLNQIIVEDLAAAEEIYIAQNGQEALDLIEEGKICPDVIVTDINMPVMDGAAFLTAYSQLSTCHKKANVLVSSATPSPTELAKILAMTIVQEQLEKPISFGTWQRLQLTYGD